MSSVNDWFKHTHMRTGGHGQSILSWQFSLPAVPMHLPPMERIHSQDPLELSESPPMKPIPPSRQERLSEARCMKAHATGMWVFLWANILVNPKQQALQYVFSFCGDVPSNPTPFLHPQLPGCPSARCLLWCESAWLQRVPHSPLILTTKLLAPSSPVHALEFEPTGENYVSLMKFSTSHAVSICQPSNLCYGKYTW